MAKDDYYVIVYKILAYLYVQLKRGEPIDEKMLSHDGKLFQINRDYWIYIMEHMLKQGFIEGITITKPWGADTIVNNLGNCRITPEGIGYLCDNNMLEKAKIFLKEVKEITPFI